MERDRPEGPEQREPDAPPARRVRDDARNDAPDARPKLKGPPGPPAPPFAMARSLLALTALVAAAAAVALAVLTGTGASDQIAPALGGAAVALAAGMVALVPLHWANRRTVAAVPALAMAGAGLRVVATLLGAAVLIGVLDMTMPATALWVLGWYLLVMLFEVTLLVRYMRQ